LDRVEIVGKIEQQDQHFKVRHSSHSASLPETCMVTFETHLLSLFLDSEIFFLLVAQTSFLCGAAAVGLVSEAVRVMRFGCMLKMKIFFFLH